MDANDDVGSLKGAALHSFLLWYASHYGIDDFEEDTAALPEHLRSLIDPSREALGILASKWYPMELAHALLDRLAVRVGPEELDRMVRKAGPDVMRSQMTGLQRRAFKLLMNPSRYRKHVGSLWRQNFDTGDIEVLETGPQEHHGFCRHWRGHHPLVCRLIHTGKEAVYEAMGCKDVTVELTGCVSDGDEACSSKVRWSP